MEERINKLINKLDKKLIITNYKQLDDTIIIYVKRTNTSATCPNCGKVSSSVHSKYFRTIKDLPMEGKKVILKLENKMFICKNKKCPIDTFAEKFNFIDSCARMTKRLKKQIVYDSEGMNVRALQKSIKEKQADISYKTILRLKRKAKKINSK